MTELTSPRNSPLNLHFVFSTLKGYASLHPLYEYMRDAGFDVALNRVHKHKFRNRELLQGISDTIVIAYDLPLYRLENSGWKGNFIYIEHGLSPVKYYTYKYEFFHRSSLLFYPGEVFKRKMEAVNPNFTSGLLGGYPKIDDLLKLHIDRESLCSELSLESSKPIVLFAPSWGGRTSRNAGIHIAKHLRNIENLLIIPHSADYRYAKKYNALIPDGGNINKYLHLADVVVSDVSSVLAEAALLRKPVLQIELSSYPGCFPEKDKRTKGIWLSDEVIRREENNTDRNRRPFKIPYIDEDWDFGHSVKPEDISHAVRKAIELPDEHSSTRQYIAEQSCWRADGKTCSRISSMIVEFIRTGIRKQID